MKYFDASPFNAVSALVKSEELSAEELRKLLDMVKKGGEVMEAMLAYLLKVSVSAILFYLFIRILMERETQHEYIKGAVDRCDCILSGSPVHICACT